MFALIKLLNFEYPETLCAVTSHAMICIYVDLYNSFIHIFETARAAICHFLPLPPLVLTPQLFKFIKFIKFNNDQAKFVVFAKAELLKWGAFLLF